MTDPMFDYVIVGTGVTGSLAADALVARGHTVCILERGRDEAYAPRSPDEYWFEQTRYAKQGERIVSLNQWGGYDDSPTKRRLFDDLAAAEQAHSDRWFGYNMRFGYGGSGAVWSGRCWRYYPEDFRTRSLFGYGLDWVIPASDMEPYYARAEALLDVSGPRSNPDWPWPEAYPMDAFPATRLDQLVTPLLSEFYRIVPTANSAKNLPTLEGGCVAAKTCVQFCPNNAIARPHIKLLEPLRRTNDRLTIQFDAQTTHLETGSDGAIIAAHVRARDGSEKRITGRRFILCANTVENIRILQNSERVTGRAIANSSGLLGRYFATHGVLLARLTHKGGLSPGQGRISTSAGLDPALGRDRSGMNAQMLEIFNFDFRRGSTAEALTQLRRSSGLHGRALLAEAAEWHRQTMLVNLFEIEMRRENRITLSDLTDQRGVPVAKFDLSHSARDTATITALSDQFRAMEAHPDCERIDIMGDGFNGNHPIGGYVASDHPKEGVTDRFGKAHDHSNLWLFGGGALNSPSCFNPTLTLAANTMRMLDDPRLV